MFLFHGHSALPPQWDCMAAPVAHGREGPVPATYGRDVQKDGGNGGHCYGGGQPLFLPKALRQLHLDLSPLATVGHQCLGVTLYGWILPKCVGVIDQNSTGSSRWAKSQCELLHYKESYGGFDHVP